MQVYQIINVNNFFSIKYYSKVIASLVKVKCQ